MTSTETRGYISTGVKTASYSKLSVPGYTTIKYRTKPSAIDHAAMKEELRKKEGKGIDAPHNGKRSAPTFDSMEETPSKKPKLEERPAEEEEEELQVEINPLDRDDSDSDPSEDEKGSSKPVEGESDEDSDDDDEELQEIQRQLERIKREKTEEKERKEREEAEAAKREREERMAGANPLMQGEEGATGGPRVAVKKWYEETIFKNQAAGEQQYKKRFINDTVRNDFHKRFLAKYVQ